MRAGPSFARGYGGQAAHAPLDKTSLPLTPGMPPSGNRLMIVELRLMIVELRLMIVEVKSWRRGGASFKNQNSTIITRQSLLLSQRD